MKKMVALACAGLMVASVVTGCGSKKDDADKSGGEKRVLKFDSFSGGNGEEVWKDLEAAFEKKYPEVDVQMRFEKDLPAVLNKENATGTYSDLVYYNVGQKSGFTESQLNSGEVMDISDVFVNAKDVDQAFADSSVSKYLGDGKNYLAPIMYTPGAFFYNAELIGEGKKYALPSTWDEMFALGDQLKKENGPALFTYPVKGYFDNTLIGMYKQLGILDKALSYDDSTWTSKEGTKILETVGKLVAKENGYLFKDTVANANAKDGFTNNQQAVIDGKALFMPNGYWVKNEMSKTTPEKGFKWGVMALPAFEKDGKRAIASFTEQAWIPKQAKNSADAKKFLEFIYSEEGAEIMLKHDIVAPVKGITDKIDKNSDLGKAFATYSEKNVETIVGASYAAYDKKALPKLDFNASLYGPIDDIATGKKDVATWKSELIKLWKELKANPVK